MKTRWASPIIIRKLLLIILLTNLVPVILTTSYAQTRRPQTAKKITTHKSTVPASKRTVAVKPYTFVPPPLVVNEPEETPSPTVEEIEGTVVSSRTQESNPNAEEIIAAPVGDNSATSSDNGDDIFTVVEQQPEFLGGSKALSEYLTQNMHYPPAAQRAKVSGQVSVRFVVEKNGEISNIQLVKGLGFGTGEEAIRLVEKIPRWTPGRQNGQPVRVWYNLPINFIMPQ